MANWTQLEVNGIKKVHQNKKAQKQPSTTGHYFLRICITKTTHSLHNMNMHNMNFSIQKKILRQNTPAATNKITNQHLHLSALYVKHR